MYGVWHVVSLLVVGEYDETSDRGVDRRHGYVEDCEMIEYDQPA